MKLYVGNIPFSMSAEELKQEFSVAGEVSDVFIPRDRNTGRPRGFAFITMADEEAGNKAISELNGKDLGGRKIVVSEARPQNNE